MSIIPNPTYDPSKPASTTNQAYVFENPQTQIINPTTGQTAASAMGTITRETLSPNKPIEVPKIPEDTNNYQGLISGGLALASAFPKPEEPQNDLVASLQKFLQEGTPSDMTGTYNQMYQESGLEGKNTAVINAQKDLDLLNAQMQSLNAEAKAVPIKLQQEYEGRGATAGGVAPIQTQRLRDIALRSLSLEGQILASQAVLTGNQNALIAAQQKFDLFFRLKQDYEDKMYDYRKEQRSRVWDYLTTKEQQQLDELQKEDDRKYQESRDNLKLGQDWAATALQNGFGNIASSITQLDPKDSNFAQNLGKLQEKIKIQEESPEQKIVSELANKYADAGISLTDTLAQAQAKLPKSRIYQDQVRGPQGPQQTQTERILEKQEGVLNEARTKLDAVRATSEDGYVHPNDYRKYKSDYIAQNGTAADFFQALPPEIYIKPENQKGDLNIYKTDSDDELINALMNIE